jgi:TPR repeat protein
MDHSTRSTKRRPNGIQAKGMGGAPSPPLLLGVLLALLTQSAAAQPGPHIDLQSQRVPDIRVTPENAPPVQVNPQRPETSVRSGSPNDSRASQPAATVTRELDQLRRSATPASGFGSTQSAAHAAWVLGLLSLHGIAVPFDPQQAVVWFRRATGANHEPLAWAGMAWCAIDGCDGPPNPPEAQAAIDKLKRVQRSRALYLQWLLDVAHKPITLAEADADSGSMSRKLPQAALLQQAAKAGDAPAQVELGVAAAARGDFALARQYFRSAASRSPAARANLRLLDEREASSHPRKGSEADQVLAQAQRFHRGDGVPLNYAEAIRLYQKAASLGSLPARRMLELILSHPTPQGSINIGWMAQLAQLDPTSNLPALDSRRFAGIMERDPTPLVDLIPAPWRQRMGTELR